MVWCLFPCPLPSNLSGRNSKVNKKSVVTGRLQLLAQKKNKEKPWHPKEMVITNGLKKKYNNARLG
jgi:hypothetical protein